MFRAIKDYFRRRQLAGHGIVQQISPHIFTAGDRSGVWTVASDFLKPDSIVYSFGVGDNLAWELAMIERFGLTVHAFDPTPASIHWVAQQALPDRLQFHPTGLAEFDGIARFAPRRPESKVNFRPLSTAPAPGTLVIEAPVCRLTTLMQQLGHTRVNVVKMDIEGGEYKALEDLVASNLDVRQILVEFHHHFADVGIDATANAVKALREAGYRIFHISDRGLEMSFLKAGIG